MVLWKKIILGLALLLVAFFIGFAMLIYHFTSDLCAETVVNQILSPNGKLKGVIFQRDCGATTDFNVHVAIIPSDSTFSKESVVETLFSADTNHGRAPRGDSGGPEIQFQWISDKRIEIQYHNFVRIIRAKSRYRGGDIDYRTFD
jgi:hypothetical protein